MDTTTGDAEERYQRAIVHAVLRSVVHDLNNPLGTITMAVAALRSAADEDERTELIDLLEREAMRAGSIATTAAEQMTVSPAPAPMTLEALVDAVRARCRSAGVDVTFAGGDGKRVDLIGDPILLPRVLAAFVADAHGSPGRHATVQVTYRVEPGTLEVSIRDDGDPVAADVARRPFRPVPPDGGTTPARTVGLAVAAARAHVRSLGGRVELTPGPERGNTVRLWLPVVGEPVRPRRALVVDDNQTMRDMLEVVLRRDGWDTAAASNGSAAAALVAEQPVDLVLLDLHVGAEHGPDIAAQLEARRPGLSRRVVYLSGDVPPSGRIDDRPAIAKPFVLEELYRLARAVASAEGPL